MTRCATLPFHFCNSSCGESNSAQWEFLRIRKKSIARCWPALAMYVRSSSLASARTEIASLGILLKAFDKLMSNQSKLDVRKKLIEVALPLDAINKACIEDKNRK